MVEQHRGGRSPSSLTTSPGRPESGLRHPLDPAADGRRPAGRDGRRVRRASTGTWPDLVAAGVADATGDRPRQRPRLLQPQRPADPAVAGAGRQRPPRGAGRRRVPGAVMVPIGFVSDHMEVVLRPRHRGARDRGAAGPAVHPRGDRRHPPALRRGRARAGAGAGRRRARRAGRPAGAGPARAEPRPLPGRLLPQPRATLTGRRLCGARLDDHGQSRRRLTCPTGRDVRTPTSPTCSPRAGGGRARPERLVARSGRGRPPARGDRHQVQPHRRRHRDGHSAPSGPIVDLHRGRPAGRRLPRRGGREHGRHQRCELGHRPDRRHRQLPLRDPGLRRQHRRQRRTTSVVVGVVANPVPRGDLDRRCAAVARSSTVDGCRLDPPPTLAHGAGRHRLRLRPRPARPAGRGPALGAAAGPRHPPDRGGVAGPVRCGDRPARRLLRARAQPLGPGGRRPDRPRGGRRGGRAARGGRPGRRWWWPRRRASTSRSRSCSPALGADELVAG